MKAQGIQGCSHTRHFHRNLHNALLTANILIGEINMLNISCLVRQWTGSHLKLFIVFPEIPQYSWKKKRIKASQKKNKKHNDLSAQESNRGKIWKDTSPETNACLMGKPHEHVNRLHPSPPLLHSIRLKRVEKSLVPLHLKPNLWPQTVWSPVQTQG